MRGILRLRITVIWLLLIVATCASWEMVQRTDFLPNSRIATAAAICVAFIKARFVMLDFMELRAAPLGLRVFAEAWCAGVCGAIVAVYLLCEGRG